MSTSLAISTPRIATITPRVTHACQPRAVQVPSIHRELSVCPVEFAASRTHAASGADAPKGSESGHAERSLASTSRASALASPRVMPPDEMAEEDGRGDHVRPNRRALAPRRARPGRAARARAARADFVNFESGQVRPLAHVARRRRGCSPSTRPTTGSRSSSLASGGPVHTASVPVGLEPVAVAARSDAEVWVVNHLSDSVSIVDVGVEPAARRAHAAGRRRAARHRLRRPRPQPRVRHHRAPRPEQPGRPAAHHRRASGAPTSGCSTRRASARTLGGTPLTIVTLFGDTPRALAASPDGSTRLRRRLPLRQPDDRDHRGRRCATAAPRPAPCTVDGVVDAGRPAGAEHQRRRACRRPRSG